MLNYGCSHDLLCWQISKFSSAPFAHIQLNRCRILPAISSLECAIMKLDGFCPRTLDSSRLPHLLISNGDNCKDHDDQGNINMWWPTSKPSKQSQDPTNKLSPCLASSQLSPLLADLWAQIWCIGVQWLILEEFFVTYRSLHIELWHQQPQNIWIPKVFGSL